MTAFSVESDGIWLEIPDARGEVIFYRVEPCEPGLDDWAVILERQEEPCSRYRVGVDGRGLWRCTCDDWKFRHTPTSAGGCKHIEHVRAIYLLMETLRAS